MSVLAFNASRLAERIAAFKENGKDSSLTIYGNDMGQYVLVTDEYATANEAKNALNTGNGFNRDYGDDRHWLSVSEIFPLSVGDLVRGSGTPALALTNAIQFGKKSLPEVGNFITGLKAPNTLA